AYEVVDLIPIPDEIHQYTYSLLGRLLLLTLLVTYHGNGLQTVYRCLRRFAHLELIILYSRLCRILQGIALSKSKHHNGSAIAGSHLHLLRRILDRPSAGNGELKPQIRMIEDVVLNKP